MNISDNMTDEVLMAYADGEFDAATRSEIERKLAMNGEWKKKVDGYRAQRLRLENAFSSVLSESVPERFTSAINGGKQASAGIASITDLTQVRTVKAANQSRWASTRWMSLAASVTLGVLIGFLLSGNRGSESIVASAKLERALSEQLASKSDSSVQIGVTYLSKSGDYCRSFAADNNAGLACRSSDHWEIRMLVPVEKSNAAYRTAASAIPVAILDRVNDEISGEPLDVDQEAAIVKRGWKAVKQ